MGSGRVKENGRGEDSHTPPAWQHHQFLGPATDFGTVCLHINLTGKPTHQAVRINPQIAKSGLSSGNAFYAR